MIVRVPFTEGMLHPRVLPAIERQRAKPDPWKIDPADPHGYRDLIELWCEIAARSHTDLVIVEHDVESRSGVLDEYRQCSRAWCFHAYRFCLPYDECGLEGKWTPLGHTRFRWTICAVLADLWPQDRWRELPGYADMDRTIGAYLTERGFVPHRHDGDVIHHHDYESQREVPGAMPLA